MRKDIHDTGFFTFELIQQVLDCKKDLIKAKTIAMKAIDEYPREAHKENIAKAKAIIYGGKSTTHMAMNMSSFILAYQGMKVMH